MELSDKTLQNLIFMAANSLRGMRTDGDALGMAELWQDVAQADTFLKEKKKNQEKVQPGQMVQMGEALMVPKAEGISEEHG